MSKKSVDVMEDVLGEDPEAVKADRPRRSFFTDEPGHNMVVMIDGYAIYAREATPDIMNSLSDADAEFQKESQRITRDRNPSKAPGTGKVVPPKLDPKEAKAQSEKAADDYHGLYNGVFCQLVTDWDLPSSDGSKRPYTPEAVAKLPHSIVKEVLKKISLKTVLGFDESDFLGAS
jgi:hypothetical protein